MKNKTYTAQEMREVADFFVRNAEMVRQKVMSNTILANIHEVIPMLRQAADAEEEDEKLKARLEEVVKVAELRHWIKSAARWIKCHDIYHTSGNDLIKRAKEILNDDGEFLFNKGER